MLQKLFDNQNPFWRFLSKLFDVMVLNLAWLLFSIPVITSGAATAAAYKVCFQIHTGEFSGTLKSFWASFKENLRQGIFMGLILLLLCCIFLFDILYFMQLQQYLPEALKYLLTGLFTLLLIAALMAGIYGFAIQALFENTVRGTLKNALILALRHPLRSVSMLALDLAFFAATTLSLYYLPAISMVLLLFGMGLVLYINSLILLPVLCKYMPEEVDEEAEPEIFD